MKQSKPQPTGPSRPPLPFMDEVHKWTFSDRYYRGEKLSPQSRKILQTYRQKLRQAERFVIDDETIKLTCQMSHHQELLPGYSVLARLPYPSMWIEFDLHTKCRAYLEMGSLRGPFNPDEVSPITGFLIFQDDHPTRWIAHSFIKVEDKTLNYYDIAPNLLTYLFDPDGEPHQTPGGSTFWRTPTLSRRPGGLQIPVKLRDKDIHGYVDAEYVLSGDLQTDPETQNITGAPWFTNRGAAIVDPFWASWKPQILTNDVLRSEIIENAGIVRWLVTFLGLINTLPKEIKTAQTRTGKRQLKSHILPYFQHKTITLNLPRDNRIVWIKKHAESNLKNMPRPWHEVIGHWRVIERGKALHLCRHMPTMVENNIAMCERCELLVRWIPAHHRGDPSVGIVSHTYKTKSPKQRAPEPEPPIFDPNFELLEPQS